MLRTMLLLGALPALAGCYPGNPYQMPGSWRPVGANEQNVRTMAANPADLQSGQASTGVTGQRAVAAVERLRQDRVKPLADTGVARLQVSGFGNTAAGAGGGAP